MTITNTIARRAVLKKEGVVDIRFELRRSSPHDFEMVENGRTTGVFWRALSPQQAMRGGQPLGLQEAWDSCLAKHFPGYTATDLEERAG